MLDNNRCRETSCITPSNTNSVPIHRKAKPIDGYAIKKKKNFKLKKKKFTKD